jgi:hypothetical protein
VRVRLGHEGLWMEWELGTRPWMSWRCYFFFYTQLERVYISGCLSPLIQQTSRRINPCSPSRGVGG